jgi:hypothetical protein
MISRNHDHTNARLMAATNCGLDGIAQWITDADKAKGRQPLWIIKRCG